MFPVTPRSRRAGEWRNWTGDQVCKPAAFERPGSVAEVADALTRARARGEKARVVGSGHSFTDAALTDGTMLSLERMDRLLDVDETTGSVKVEAGITLHALNERLARHGRALENLGDIDVQSLAGAISTGTHGTGGRYRNISASIRAVELTLADGSTVECSEGSDEAAWRAARVGLGALGVITAVTLDTVPAFTLHGFDETKPLEAVFEELDASIDSNEHFEFYTFPYSPLALTRTNNRVDEAPRPRSATSAWLHDVVLVNYVFGTVCRTGRRVPALIPALNRMTARLAGSSERVDASYRIFSSPRLVRFTESEYAIPRAHAVEAVRAIHAAIEHFGLDVPFPLEVRFAAPDDAYLSPAHGRDTCYIAAHMFQGMEWRPYFRTFRAIMSELGGRPHWGKRHFESEETLTPLYPGWSAFAEVRNRLDPGGVFDNAYTRRVLGPVRDRPV